MKSGFLPQRKDVPKFASIPAVQKLLQSKQRVDAIINNLKDDSSLDAQQLQPSDRVDAIPRRREKLYEERFDRHASTILEEVKQAVAVSELKDKASKTALGEFLDTYCDLRSKEEQIYSHDREVVLLNLKTHLEFMGDTIPGINCNSSETLENTNVALESGQKNCKYSSLDDSITLQEMELEIATTLKSLEGLKKTHKQTMKAKSQIEGLCACLEFRKMQAQTNRVELLKQSEVLSKELTTMKEALSSKRCQSTGEHQSAFEELRTKLAGARRTYERWKMQEVILSSLVDHRNEKLKGLQNSIENHPGQALKEDFALQESALKLDRFSKSREYSERLTLVLNEMQELKSDMLNHSTIYQSTIRKNLEPFMKTFGVFENLETSLITANDNWSQTPVILSKCALTVNDRQLEHRLQDTVRRVSSEKKVLAKDISFLRFVAQDDSTGQEGNNPNTGFNATLSEDQIFDSLSSKQTHYLVNDFVTKSKETFLTMYALKRLDTCQGYSCSKLNVLKFDLIHQKTYLESRNDIILLTCNLDLENLQREDSRPRTLKKTTGKRTSATTTSKGPFDTFQSQTFCPWKSDSNEFKIDLNGVSLPQLVSGGNRPARSVASDKSLSLGVVSRNEQLQHSVALPLNRTESANVCDEGDVNANVSSFKACSEYTDNEELSAMPEPMGHVESPNWFYSEESPNIIVSSFREYHNYCDDSILNEERLLEEQFLLKDHQIDYEQTASDMARHFRFYEQAFAPSRSCLPKKFLFYTKGIGVFVDAQGGLVDALGMPFSKVRQCPGKPAKLRAMTSEAINQLGRKRMSAMRSKEKL